MSWSVSADQPAQSAKSPGCNGNPGNFHTTYTRDCRAMGTFRNPMEEGDTQGLLGYKEASAYVPVVCGTYPYPGSVAASIYCISVPF